MDVTFFSGNEKVELNGSPFRLLKTIDLSGLEATINTATTGSDGAMFLNARYNTRDIEIEGMIDCYQKSDSWTQEKRNLLMRLFDPKSEVKVQITENGQTYFLMARPSSFPVFKVEKASKNANFQTFLIQMTCTDPYLYKNEQVVTFANVTPLFSFPLSFNAVTMGNKNDTLIESIYNSGNMEAPIKIKLEALQEVTNPYLLNVYTQKQIKLNTTLLAGDKILIDTGRKKEISRIRNGVKESFYYSLDLESDFLQLEKGDNILRVGAETGEDALRIEVSYNERLGGI